LARLDAYTGANTHTISPPGSTTGLITKEAKLLFFVPTFHLIPSTANVRRSASESAPPAW